MAHGSTTEIDDLIFIAETDKAILFRQDDVEEEDAETGENQWWVPKSLIEWTDMHRKGDEGSIEVPEWFAEKEGIS